MRVVVFMLLVLASMAHAAAPVMPPCRPGQTTTPVGTKSYICIDWMTGTFAERWFCDAKVDATSPTGYVQTGQWWSYGYGDATVHNLVGNAQIAAVSAYKAAKEAMAGQTDDQLRAWWSANITNQPVNICDPTSPDYAACQTYSTCGRPEFWPPSGIRTQATAVYKQSVKINDPSSGSYTLKKFATIALGVPCDQNTFVVTATEGRVFAVPRSAVKKNSVFDTYPPISYATCE